MLFIGIFGVESKEKEIKVLNNLSCKSCSDPSTGRLIKSYNYFHFFFIPLIKWNEAYHVICNNCNTIFTIPKEKGKSIERGEEISITYWDLKERENYYGNYNRKICRSCNNDIDNNFKFCPYCGEKL